MMRVLVTRPEFDATREAEALTARGHEPVLAPLLAIEFLPGVSLDLDGAQALIVTSRNALRALAAHAELKQALALPLFAGGATAWLRRGDHRSRHGRRPAAADPHGASPREGRARACRRRSGGFRPEAVARRGGVHLPPAGALPVPSGRNAFRRDCGRSYVWRHLRRHPPVAAPRQDLCRAGRASRSGNASSGPCLLLPVPGGSRGGNAISYTHLT